jgi:hypothetical protein
MYDGYCESLEEIGTLENFIRVNNKFDLFLKLTHPMILIAFHNNGWTQTSSGIHTGPCDWSL